MNTYNLICLIEDAEQAGDTQTIEYGIMAREELQNIEDKLKNLRKIVREIYEDANDGTLKIGYGKVSWNLLLEAKRILDGKE